MFHSPAPSGPAAVGLWGLEPTNTHLTESPTNSSKYSPVDKIWCLIPYPSILGVETGEPWQVKGQLHRVFHTRLSKTLYKQSYQPTRSCNDTLHVQVSKQQSIRPGPID